MNNNIIDRCKRCGCTSLECKHCNNNEFYRHVNDITKKRSNMSLIKLRGLYNVLHKR